MVLNIMVEAIHVTGKFNYAAYSKYLVSKGEDNVLNPGLVSSKYAADSACYWWKFINRSVSKSQRRIIFFSSKNCYSCC
jgi:predicted chitinase